MSEPQAFGEIPKNAADRSHGRREAFVLTRLPEEYRPANLIDFKPGEVYGEIPGQEPRSCFIFGKIGTGKTYLACALAKAWQLSTCFARAVDVCSLALERFNTKSKSDESDWLPRFLKYGLLILDDLGAENQNSEHAKESLYRLLDERINRGLATIVTSNYSVPALVQKNERLGSRCASMRILETVAKRDRRIGKDGQIISHDRQKLGEDIVDCWQQLWSKYEREEQAKMRAWLARPRLERQELCKRALERRPSLPYMAARFLNARACETLSTTDNLTHVLLNAPTLWVVLALEADNPIASF